MENADHKHHIVSKRVHNNLRQRSEHKLSRALLLSGAPAVWKRQQVSWPSCNRRISSEAFLDLAHEPIVVLDQALDRFASRILRIRAALLGNSSECGLQFGRQRIGD